MQLIYFRDVADKLLKQSSFDKNLDQRIVFLEQLTTQHTKQVADMKSDIRKQDTQTKNQGNRIDTECDRLRQMVDAIGDQVQKEGDQNRERIEQVVREVLREIEGGNLGYSVLKQVNKDQMEPDRHIERSKSANNAALNGPEANGPSRNSQNDTLD